MDIAFVIDHFDPARGGAETYLCSIVRRLAADGHRVSVYCMDHDQAHSSGVTIVKVPIIRFGRFFRALSFVIMSRRLLRKASHDVVHALGKTTFMNVFQPHGGVFLRSLKQNIAACDSFVSRTVKRCGVIFNPKKVLFMICERIQYSIKPHPLFIAISDFVKEDMMSYYGVPEDKIEVLWNAVSVPAPARRFGRNERMALKRGLGCPENAVLLVFVAHNFVLKGLRTVLRSLRMLNCGPVGIRPAVWLAVAGGGSRRPYLKLARKLGVEDKVLFLGRVKDIGRLYSACDIFVMPTFFDPCSIATIEALSAGLPVITTRFNGAGALIEEGVNGAVIADPHDAAACANAIAIFLDEKTRSRAAEAAGIFQAVFSMETHYAKLLDIYGRAKRL